MVLMSALSQAREDRWEVAAFDIKATNTSIEKHPRKECRTLKELVKALIR